MRFVKLTIVAFLAIVAAWAGAVPRPAPPLSLPTTHGERISLEDYRGKVVLLKFFLTDCPHCQRSAATIMPIYKEWRSRGMEVLAVAINPDAASKIPDFIQRFGVTYPIVMGGRSSLTSFADLSVVSRFFVPYMFLIDRQGVIRFEHPGGDAFYQNEDQNLRTELDALLKEPARAARKTSRRASK
ncbi:MAG: TlpA family protein disulfide reductase [Acidobacteria bacterium]|nr:TlpA family protein disulfide reductase [Acidobacteriota bacterium]